MRRRRGCYVFARGVARESAKRGKDQVTRRDSVARHTMLDNWRLAAGLYGEWRGYNKFWKNEPGGGSGLLQVEDSSLWGDHRAAELGSPNPGRPP
jgi:hypothetical protein